MYDDARYASREARRDARRALREARRAARGQRHFSGRLFAGLMVIALGAALALDKWGYMPFERSLRLWPIVLLLLAAHAFWRRGLYSVGGHVLLLLGAAAELRHLGYRHLVSQWWPLGLVWVGVIITLRALRPEPLPPVESE